MNLLNGKNINIIRTAKFKRIHLIQYFTMSLFSPQFELSDE